MRNLRNIERIIFHFNNDNSGSTAALRNRVYKQALDDYLIITLSHGGALDDLRTMGIMSKTTARYFPIAFQLFYFWIVTSLISLIAFKRFQEFNNILSVPSMLVLSLLFPYGNRHILYLHEFKVNNKWLNLILSLSLKLLRSNYIFVSEYHKNYFCTHFGITGKVCLNVLDPVFCDISPEIRKRPYSARKRITFVGSTSVYKGLGTFLELASRINLTKDITWTIVTPQAIEIALDQNYEVYNNPNKEHLAEIYSESLIVMNLSRTDMWIETFGMTIFEGSAFGALTITPDIGGFLDYVRSEWSYSFDTSARLETQYAKLEQILFFLLSEDIWMAKQAKLLEDIESVPELKTILGY